MQVGNSISSLPEGFNPHKGIKRVFDGRRKMVESGEGVDWGFAEALAFGTLVSEGGGSNPTSPLMASHIVPHLALVSFSKHAPDRHWHSVTCCF